jgi:hypothetical protein
MIVICLNGPINAGKSTIGRVLAGMLPDAEFIEGDDHGIPEGVPFEEMIERATAWLAGLIAEKQRAFLVIAYPLRPEDFALLREACAKRGARLFVVTLAPPMELALKDRGDRKLDDEERARIREMYAEGYAARNFSDMIVTNVESPEVMALRVTKMVMPPDAP